MYHFSKILDTSFENAIALVTKALKQEGFGVLTQIDVKATLNKKLDVDFRPYLILGACHPQIAYQMLEIEDKAGVLYPCNVVVQEHTDGIVEVSAIDPLAMFRDIHKSEAQELAIQASHKMRRVINSLSTAQLVTQS